MNEEVRIQDRRYNPYQGNYEKALKGAPESATIHAYFALQLAKNNLTLDYAEKLIGFAISKAPESGLFLAIKGFVLLMKLN